MYCEDCGFWQHHDWHTVTKNYSWLTTMKEIHFLRCNACNKINDSKVVFHK